MVKIRVKALLRLSFALVVLFVLYVSFLRNQQSVSSSVVTEYKGRVHLAVVACHGKSKGIVQEAANMIKSAVIFSTEALNIHIFTDALTKDFNQEFSRWPREILRTHNIQFHNVEYRLPANEKARIKDWWGPCSSYRLFLPESLPDVDSILYVDTDVLFMCPVHEIWDHFQRFNKIQVAALAPRVGWDFKVSSHNPNFILTPTGKFTQVNAGVFLMNLTRMRRDIFRSDPSISKELHAWNWGYLKPLYVNNKEFMHGDQNLINTVFHYNPHLLYFLPCKYNYHHKFCFDNRPERRCDSAMKDGAAVLHGSANTFYNNYAPAFSVANKVFRKYDFEDDWESHLVQPMLTLLSHPRIDKHEHCGGKKNLLTLHLKKTIRRLKTDLDINVIRTG